MKKAKTPPLVIYQAKNGAIELKGDVSHQTIWATQAQIAQIFEKDQSVISRHIRNIFKSGEVDQKSNVQKMHIANSDKPVSFYSLDIILAVGYRTNSARAIMFRRWATKTLRQYLLDGYVVNKKQIKRNYSKFIQALSDIKAVLPANSEVRTRSVLELVQTFANTWLSLEAYDEDKLPTTGKNQKQVIIEAVELRSALDQLKNKLVAQKQAADIFAKEREKGSLETIVASVFQSAFGQDAYPSLEEKAAHLLYFMVKNHPFVDGNKRSGAFAFVWFLQRVGLLKASLTPEALTTLTLLVAESKPKDKEKIIGLMLLLF